MLCTSYTAIVSALNELMGRPTLSPLVSYFVLLCCQYENPACYTLLGLYVHNTFGERACAGCLAMHVVNLEVGGVCGYIE